MSHITAKKDPKGKDSKDKKKPERHAERSSKPTASEQPRLPTIELPQDFGFLWSIDKVEAKYAKKPRRLLGVGHEKGNDIAAIWYPPNSSRHFDRERGNLYRWRRDGSEVFENNTPPKKRFEVASLFFQSRQDNFVVSDRDCAEDDIKKTDRGWCHIGFNHNQSLSEVLIGGEHFLLAAPANGATWMPQVLPEVYNYNLKGPNAKKISPAGGLCGKLSLLIGMAAFSAEEQHAEITVAKCFKFGMWENHQFDTGIGRYEDRGVVVSIYSDPTVVGITDKHLKDFEAGHYGPIFATLSTTQPTTQTTPRVQSISYSSTSQLTSTQQSTLAYPNVQTTPKYTWVASSVASSILSARVTEHNSPRTYDPVLIQQTRPIQSLRARNLTNSEADPGDEPEEE